MAGHNKWSKIKHKKASEDAKKSKVFAMHVKAITVEARKSGGDINSPGLRAAVDRAKAVNMPADNINRAIEKGCSSAAGDLEEVVYEAYGPGGAAIIIEGITDNKNRTTPEIKHLLSKTGGSLGGQNSALWAFRKTDDGFVATTLIPLQEDDQEKITALIEELNNHDDVKNVFTNADLG